MAKIKMAQVAPYSITLAMAQRLTDDELLDAYRTDRLKGQDARELAWKRVGDRIQEYARVMWGG